MSILKIVHKFMYFTGALTVLTSVYVFIFFLISTYIIYPYESENMLKTHSLRPAYNYIFYPLRWFNANGRSFREEDIKSDYGWLREPLFSNEDREKDMRSAMLDAFDGSSISIGFTGSQEVLDSYDLLKLGEYVKLTFGVALAKDGDNFINRLISIEVIDLMDDPRIHSKNLSAQENKKISKSFNSLQGKQKNCASDFIKTYEKNVLKHCLQAGYAKDIGGGCYHVVGYISTNVLKKAIDVCLRNLK